MSPDDEQVRKDICQACRRECAVRETIDHADPCVGCPFKVWHAMGRCEQHVATPTSAAAPVRIVKWSGRAPTFRQRLRAYHRAGFALLTSRARHARRDICAACPQSELTEVKGLYRCKLKCRPCGGGDEIRMIMPTTACDLGLWPAITRPFAAK